MSALDPQRRRDAALRAVQRRQDAEQLRMEANTLDAGAAVIERTWQLEPGEVPAATLDILPDTD